MVISPKATAVTSSVWVLFSSVYSSDYIFLIGCLFSYDFIDICYKFVTSLIGFGLFYRSNMATTGS